MFVVCSDLETHACIEICLYVQAEVRSGESTFSRTFTTHVHTLFILEESARNTAYSVFMLCSDLKNQHIIQPNLHVCMLCVQIWRINTQYNVLYVHSPCVPGPPHGMVRVYDTTLPHVRPTPDNHPPLPTWTSEDSADGVAQEYFDSDLHKMQDPSIVYQ